MNQEKTLGQVGFEAYSESKGGTTYDGRKIPAWDEVGDDVQEAWEAAGLAIEAAIKCWNDLDEENYLLSLSSSACE